MLWHALRNLFCVHTPVAFSEFRLTGRENATNRKKKNLDEVADFIVNVFWKSLCVSVPHELLHRSPLV